LLLMGYYFFVASPASEEIEKISRLVRVAKTRVPSPQIISQTAQDLRKAIAEVNAKREQVKKRENRSKEQLANWDNLEAKARSGEKIGELLAQNQVILLEESMAEDADRERFSSLLESMPSAELWKLRLAGSFDSIRRTIITLGQTDLPVVPAAIEMEPLVQGNKSIHLWNLWICR
ncbi:MAG: hypothetical protein AAF984_04050, partial [Verrucomicrobiota bacterium]